VRERRGGQEAAGFGCTVPYRHETPPGFCWQESALACSAIIVAARLFSVPGRGFRVHSLLFGTWGLKSGNWGFGFGNWGLGFGG